MTIGKPSVAAADPAMILSVRRRVVSEERMPAEGFLSIASPELQQFTIRQSGRPQNRSPCRFLPPEHQPRPVGIHGAHLADSEAGRKTCSHYIPLIEVHPVSARLFRMNDPDPAAVWQPRH